MSQANLISTAIRDVLNRKNPALPTDASAPAHPVSGVSRRVAMNIVVSASALSALVTPALAGGLPAPVQETADHEIIGLEQKLYSAWAALEDVCRDSKAEEAVFAWKVRNPCPKMRECVVGTNAEYEIWFKQFAEADDPSQVTAKNPNADLEAAMKEHESAIREWKIRKSAAERQAGLEEAEKRQQIANDELTRLVEALVEARATTLFGLLSKARVAHIDEEIATSIVNDLLAMNAEVSS